MSVYPFGTSPEQRVSLGVKDPSGIDLDHRVAVSTPICRVIAFPRLEPGQRRSGHTKEVWKHLLVAQIPETGLTLAVWRPVDNCRDTGVRDRSRSEEHTSELQSLMRISYAVFCL